MTLTLAALRALDWKPTEVGKAGHVASQGCAQWAIAASTSSYQWKRHAVGENEPAFKLLQSQDSSSSSCELQS
jgi:hypothetical protein